MAWNDNMEACRVYRLAPYACFHELPFQTKLFEHFRLNLANQYDTLLSNLFGSFFVFKVKGVYG